MSVAATPDGGFRSAGLSWFAIIRLGLVQTALGCVLVMTNSTLNRVMAVELGFAALVPAALITLYYALQTMRPHWGHGSDTGAKARLWILGGGALFCIGGVTAAAATLLMAESMALGFALAFFAYTLVGLGVGCAGTFVLAVLASGVAPARRPAAASLVWIMMIIGFAVTAAVAGEALEPFSLNRMVGVAGGVSLAAFVLVLIAVSGMTPLARSVDPQDATAPRAPKPPLSKAFAKVWRDEEARRFTLFVFLSMVAFNAQDVILEPFAGAVFGMSAGESTKLSGFQHQGVLIGLLLVAFAGRRLGSLKLWMIVGCGASALAFGGLAFAAVMGAGWPITVNVVILGAATGVFAGAAVASMMALAGADGGGSEGVRMGVWGMAQAFGSGSANLIGAGIKDVTFVATGSQATAYGSVFIFEGVLFAAAALLAARIAAPAASSKIRADMPVVGDLDAVEAAR